MLPVIMDVAAFAACVFSPSKTCKVRVSASRYRHDPYRARVFAAASLLHAAMPPAAIAPAAPIADEVPKPVPAASLAPLNWSKLLPTVVAPVSPKKAAPVEIVKPLTKPQAPVAAVHAAAKIHYALVGFKHETAMYQAPFRVAVGDVVVVEADRGEHIGVVQEITTVAPKYNVPSRVLRHACKKEFDAIDELTQREKSATAGIQKLSESLGLGIRIVDTEFQMDGNKLTVFFSSKVFVDFRKLQRCLFRDYRCRIWLVNWSEVSTYTPVPVNAISNKA